MRSRWEMKVCCRHFCTGFYHITTATLHPSLSIISLSPLCVAASHPTCISLTDMLLLCSAFIVIHVLFLHHKTNFYFRSLYVQHIKRHALKRKHEEQPRNRIVKLDLDNLLSRVFLLLVEQFGIFSLFGTWSWCRYR